MKRILNFSSPVQKKKLFISYLLPSFWRNAKWKLNTTRLLQISRLVCYSFSHPSPQPYKQILPAAGSGTNTQQYMAAPHSTHGASLQPGETSTALRDASMQLRWLPARLHCNSGEPRYCITTPAARQCFIATPTVPAMLNHRTGGPRRCYDATPAGPRCYTKITGKPPDCITMSFTDRQRHAARPRPHHRRLLQHNLLLQPPAANLLHRAAAW